MRRFPGRTLEELDSMDVGRFLRAVEAERIEGVEERRRQNLKNPKSTKLSTAEYEMLDDHERMLKRAKRDG